MTKILIVEDELDRDSFDIVLADHFLPGKMRGIIAECQLMLLSE